jgi:hypothetical protein
MTTSALQSQPQIELLSRLAEPRSGQTIPLPTDFRQERRQLDSLQAEGERQ